MNKTKQQLESEIKDLEIEKEHYMQKKRMDLFKSSPKVKYLMGQLEGFVRGKNETQKEFLDFLIKHCSDRLIIRCDVIDDKIKELKQSLSQKEVKR